MKHFEAVLWACTAVSLHDGHHPALVFLASAFAGSAVTLDVRNALRVRKLRRKLSDLPIDGNERKRLAMLVELARLGVDVDVSIANHVEFVASERLIAFERLRLGIMNKAIAEARGDEPAQH